MHIIFCVCKLNDIRNAPIICVCVCSVSDADQWLDNGGGVGTWIQVFKIPCDHPPPVKTSKY